MIPHLCQFGDCFYWKLLSEYTVLARAATHPTENRNKLQPTERVILKPCSQQKQVRPDTHPCTTDNKIKQYRLSQLLVKQSRMNYFTGSNAYSEAWDYLKDHKDREGGTDRIIVENKTKYALEYVTNGKLTGVAVGDVKRSFMDKGN